MGSDASRPERPPAYDIGAIYKLRDQLAGRTLWAYRSCQLTGDTLAEFIGDIQRVVKAEHAVLYDSVQHLAGTRMNQQKLIELAWRLAGNKRTLETGTSVPPWTVQREFEWVPIQITACQLSLIGKREQRGATYRGRILAGTPCPLTIIKGWTSGFCSMLARRAGYSWRKYRYSDMSQLVNMRFMVLLDPSRSRDRPDFEEIGCTPGLQKWNRSIIQKRFRMQGKDPWPCPRGYDHQCHECHVGYVECPAATHRETYPPG